MIIGPPRPPPSTWDDIEECLMEVEDAIPTTKIASFTHDVYELKEWGLRQEALHRVRLDQAVKHRIQNGRWPDDLSSIEGHLLRIRIRAIIQRIEWLAAWEPNPPHSVEVVLERLALTEWRRVRYSAHLTDTWGLSLVSSVDDPFFDDPGHSA